MTEAHFEFKYYVSENEVRVELQGLEVMRLELNSANLAKAMYTTIIAAEPEVFMHTTDEEQRQRIYAGVKERFGMLGLKIGDDVLREHESEALRQLGYQYIKESVEASIERIREHLPRIMEMINDKIVSAAFFGGANKLRDIVNQPKGKYTAREIKDAVFEKDWELIKPLIGISTGGPRNVKHVWTDKDRECLASNYAELQPIWIEAKKIAKAAQESREERRKREWKKAVLAVYENIPMDLLERFENLRHDDAKPSDIAILHAARLCLPPNIELSVVRLRKELTAWKNRRGV